MNYYVYKITNAINGKLYFGITKQPLHKRWIQHKCSSTRKNYHLYNAIRKYGFENFKIKIIRKCNTEMEMYILEKEMIAKHNTTNPNYGYNNSIGGEISSMGSKRTIEQRNNISKYQKGRKRKPHSSEAKINMSKSAKGRDMSKPVAISAKKRKGKPAHNRRIIYSVNINNETQYYESLTWASHITGISISAIANNLSNKSKTAGGVIWHYQ